MKALLAKLKALYEKLKAKIAEYFKLKQWIQFVGYMLMAGGYVAGTSLGLGHYLHAHALGIIFLGYGVSLAGFVYELIYP